MLQIIDIKNLVINLLEFIQIDSSTNPKEESTFLYKLFHGKKDGNFDFYTQAKSLFIRDDRNIKKIKVVLEYPKDKTPLPCYVIKEPTRMNGPYNSIGKMSGQMDTYGNMMFRDSRMVNFEILCFTENMLESIIMSETLYALFLASYNILAQEYDKLEFGMKELMMETNLIPLPIFIRSVNMNVIYNESIAELSINSELLGKVIFEDAGLEATYLSNGEVIEGQPGVYSEIKGEI